MKPSSKPFFHPPTTSTANTHNLCPNKKQHSPSNNNTNSDNFHIYISYLFLSYLFLSYLFLSYLFLSYLFLSYILYIKSHTMNIVMCRRHIIGKKETNHITLFLFTVLKHFVSIIQSTQCLCLPILDKMNHILLFNNSIGER
jgi:hypothetical protein